MGDDRPLPAFTVGLEGSPDITAARAMAEALGGDHARGVIMGWVRGGHDVMGARGA
jgi:asparagine synthetase B (glutamine-hydrolysing)